MTKSGLIRRITAGVGLLTAVLAGGVAHASVIWDYSPATTQASITPPEYGGVGGNWSNWSYGQNFAESVSFAAGATVTGMDIYSGPTWGSVGDSVTIRLWSDLNGSPDLLLQEMVTTISAIDDDGAVLGVNRKHADIAPLILTAGTRYWIGMSGVTEIAQAGLTTVDDGVMAQFNNTDFLYLQTIGDMAFRLEGTSDPVPEPGTFILLGGGFAGLAFYRRKHRRADVA